MSESSFTGWGGVGAGSETDRQSFPVPDWPQGRMGQSAPDGDNDTDDLGSYVPINLPPNPGPRAADIAGPTQVTGDNPLSGGSIYG
jgi:hypothetical protein